MGRKVQEDYYTLAQKRKIKWIGRFPKNVRTKTLWECPKGHKWESTYDGINQGHNCPYCAGVAPKVIRDYYDLAKKRGFEWLGEKLPKTTRIKTSWRCSLGHRWEANYSNISQGRGCPVCGTKSSIAKRRNQPTDYHAVAQKYDFKWLGPNPENIHSKTWWECSRGHRWEGLYSNIYQGEGCPYCANRVPKIARDYISLAESQGFRWIESEVPKDTSTKTSWKCSMEHEWKASYGSIQQGHGCPHCAGNAPKTSRDYHALATKRNFKWLGPEVPNTESKTIWECSNSHQWESCYGYIQQGTGCPYCAGVVHKLPVDYHALAQKRGFRWLGSRVSNIQIKTSWECKGGHQWESTYGNIRAGTGCPECIDIVNGHHVSAPQRQLCEMLGGELNHPCGSYRIDIALLDKIIAIEYDSWYWHGGRLEDDIERDKKLLSSGWKLLHIKTGKLFPSQREIMEAIFQLEAGRDKIEIILGDWGKGITFANKTMV